MHTYSTNAQERKYVPLILAVLSVVFAWGFSKLIDVANISIPWWVDAPSVFGFYGLLYAVYSKYMWRFRMGPLRFSRIPDLRGTWVGELVSSYKDENGSPVRKQLMLHIHQSWTQLGVNVFAGTSESVSTMGKIESCDSQKPKIMYSYQNKPDPLEVETMNMHEGLASLTISEENVLKGEYFNGRGRSTFGKIEVKRVDRGYLNEASAREAEGRE